MDTVIYHKNCADGFGAALSAWTKLGEEETRYVPVQYGEEPPSVDEGRIVTILDFSFPRDVLEKLAQKASCVFVLDHHKTAQAQLAGLPDPYDTGQFTGLCAHFDMEQSGAMLAWKHYWMDHGGTPDLIRYIQDRDLWHWKLPYSREISAGLRCVPKTFEAWKRYLIGVEDLKILGRGALAITDEVSASQARRASAIPIFDLLGTALKIKGGNATAFISETCEKILAADPQTDVACCYFELSAYEREYSLRSRDPSGPDVSEIAKRFGGGGHKYAAGFKVKNDTPEIHS